MHTAAHRKIWHRSDGLDSKLIRASEMGKMLQSNRRERDACVIDWKTEDSLVQFLLIFCFRFYETVIAHSIYVSDKKIKNVTQLECRHYVARVEWIASHAPTYNAHLHPKAESKMDVRRRTEGEEKRKAKQRCSHRTICWFTLSSSGSWPSSASFLQFDKFVSTFPLLLPFHAAVAAVAVTSTILLPTRSHTHSHRP